MKFPRAAVLIGAVAALLWAGIVACGSEQQAEPEPDPRDAVERYVSANNQALVAALAEQLVNLNAR